MNQESSLKELQAAASTVYYASVLPGTGKTRWAIDKIVQRLRTFADVTFYVAPTVRLLEEVYKELESRLKASELSRYVHLVISESDSEKTPIKVRGIVHGDPDKYGAARKPCPPGTIILLTHETFIRLPHGYDTDGNPRFPLRQKVTVIFDEARKCSIKKESFRMPLHIANELSTKYLEFEGTGKYRKLKLRSKFDTGAFDALFAGKKELRKLREKLLALLHTVDDSSMHLFGALDLEEDQQDDSLLWMVLQTVLVPYQIFYGWAHVVLLSAFFEDSQMYHLLRTRDVSDRGREETKSNFRKRIAQAVGDGDGAYIMLADITNRVVDAQRLAIVKQRYADTTITYISPNISFAQKHLQRGVMVDSDLMTPTCKFDLSAFYKEYKTLALDRRTDVGGKLLPFRVAVKHLGKRLDEPTMHDYAIRAHLKKLPGLVTKYTPLQWYVKSAVFISRAWYKMNRKKPLPVPVTVNVGAEGGRNRSMRYWVREVLKVVNEGVDCIEMPMQSHGLNQFKHHDTIAFLATLNPHPEVKELFAQICPEYNADLDHTLDQCIQSATRCSLRDTKSKSKPLLIVTDKHLALRVQAQLRGLPKIIPPQKFGLPLKDPTYVLVDEDNAERQRRRRTKLSVQTKERAKRSAPEAKAKLAAWNAYLIANSAHARAYRKLQARVSQLRKNSNSEEYKQKLAEFEQIKPLRNEDAKRLRSIFNTQYRSNNVAQ